MNNLETFKCYNFFSQNFPGCIILKEEDFINLNVKYGLVSGPLSYYKGDIPEDNLDEILATKTTLDSLTDNKYSNRDNALITNVKVNVNGNSVKVKGNVGGSIEANSIEVGGDVEGDITANSVKVRGKHTGSISM